MFILCAVVFLSVLPVCALTKTGNITIAKVAEGGGAQLFHFAGDLGLMALADGNTGTQYNLPAGDYDIWEDVPDDWVLTDITCDGGDCSPTRNRVTVHLDMGEHITCTFTNEHNVGNITIAKVAEGGGSQLFHFAGDLGLMALADGYTGTQYNIPVGDYDIWEEVPDNWVLTDVTCNGGDCSPIENGVIVHLDRGEHITCTFTNEHNVGNITVAKVAEGGGSQLFHFAGDLGLMALADGYTGTQYNIPVGDYDIWEEVPDDWVLTDVTCNSGDCSPIENGVTVHLDMGEHITCTFTNVNRQNTAMPWIPLLLLDDQSND